MTQGSTVPDTLGSRQGIGDNDEGVESSSANLMETDEGFTPVFFTPHPLTNLLLIDELDSLAPMLDMKVHFQPLPPPPSFHPRCPPFILKALVPDPSPNHRSVSCPTPCFPSPLR